MPPTLIDWHAHHTPPELVTEFAGLGGRTPKPDPYDSPRFSNRIAEMDTTGIDIQLISQGAGLNADRLPPEQAMAIVRRSNDLIGDRIALYPDRLMGTIAFTWADPAGSAEEIERVAGQEPGGLPRRPHVCPGRHDRSTGDGADLRRDRAT
jgi:predicted TIM-barrel fold metal-dependent hydrolase